MRTWPLHAVVSLTVLFAGLLSNVPSAAATDGGTTAYSTTTMLASACALAGKPGAEFVCDSTDLLNTATYSNTLTASDVGEGTSASATSPISYSASTQGEPVYPATLDSLTTNVSMSGSAVKQPADEQGNAGYGAEAGMGGHTTTYFQVTAGAVPYSITAALSPDADDCTRLMVELKGSFDAGGQQIVYRRSANNTANCTQTQPAPQADIGTGSGTLAPGWYDLEVRWSVKAPTVPWLPDRSISATLNSNLQFTNTPQPGLSVSDTSVEEGDDGLTPVTLAVSLPSPATENVSVEYTTVDGSASAGTDYGSAADTLHFSPGEQTQEINLGVQGDRIREPDETFSIVLSNPVGAAITDGLGAATILNDDVCDNEFTAGADVITGTGGPDVLCGGGGNDVIRGADGNDRILGGPGEDEIYGGPGRDHLSGGSGMNGIEGGVGNDTVVGGPNFDGVQGGPGADTISGGDDSDILVGGDGNDTIHGQGGGDDILGAAGQDVLDGGAMRDELQGGGDADTLRGNTADDLLHGGGGSDRLLGGSGADGIDGNEGADLVLAGSGDDVGSGGPGDDEMRGEGGADWLLGNADSDRIIGGPGEGDELYGGGGSDTLRACNVGLDEVQGNDGNDRGWVENQDLTSGIENEHPC